MDTNGIKWGQSDLNRYINQLVILTLLLSGAWAKRQLSGCIKSLLLCISRTFQG